MPPEAQLPTSAAPPPPPRCPPPPRAPCPVPSPRRPAPRAVRTSEVPPPSPAACMTAGARPGCARTTCCCAAAPSGTRTPSWASSSTQVRAPRGPRLPACARRGLGRVRVSGLSTRPVPRRRHRGALTHRGPCPFVARTRDQGPAEQQRPAVQAQQARAADELRRAVVRARARVHVPALRGR